MRAQIGRSRHRWDAREPSQSPAGSIDDFRYWVLFSGQHLDIENVAIPRRVHRRFPATSTSSIENGSRQRMSQSPAGSIDDFREV